MVTTISRPGAYGNAKDSRGVPPVKGDAHLVPPGAEEVSLLDSLPLVGASLVASTVAMFVVLSLAVTFWLPGSIPGELEHQAVAVALTMQAAAILQDFFVKQRILAHQIWLERALLTVKILSTVTNAAIYIFPTPFIADPMTGRPNSMMRWAEWTVLAGAMTFIVESIDSRDLRTTMLYAG